MKELALTVPDAKYTPIQIQPPEGIPTGLPLSNLVSTALHAAMIIGIFLSLAYLIYGGWFWLQSKGDKQQLDKARRILIYAVLGLVVMSLSLVVVNVISQALTGKSTIGSTP
jgi:hypothetical protein